MKIAIFTPNLSRNCGGVETYALAMANVLSKDHEVVFYVLKNSDKLFKISEIYKKYNSKEFETRYVNYVITGHKYIKEFGYLQLKNMIKEIDYEFDLFINCTFGKLIAPKKIKAIHIVHFPDEPYKKVFGKYIGSILDRYYLSSYNLLLCNSNFTASHLKKIWDVEGEVLAPPISMETITMKELSQKEDIILAVDRLVPDKKVKEMVMSFLELKKKLTTSYKLIIVGNQDSREKKYYQELISLASDSDIEIKSGVSFSELKSLYKRSKIFWHAKGYEVPDDKPFDMEHFGMTTVEAMANGCVPIVINKAGQKEIVDERINGFKWESLEELVKRTYMLIKDDKLLRSLQKPAIEKSKQYLIPSFENKLKEYMNRVMENYDD